MRKSVMFAVPVLVLSLVGCGNDSNPPVQVATLTQEQIKAEEKHHLEVSDVEKKREETLPKAAYIPREEAAIDEAERAHESALSGAARAQRASPPPR